MSRLHATFARFSERDGDGAGAGRGRLETDLRGKEPGGGCRPERKCLVTRCGSSWKVQLRSHSARVVSLFHLSDRREKWHVVW